MNPDAHKQFHKKVKEFRATRPDEIFVIVGDWNAKNFVKNDGYTIREEIVSDCMNICELDQFNMFPNLHGNVLDLLKHILL